MVFFTLLYFSVFLTVEFLDFALVEEYEFSDDWLF